MKRYKYTKLLKLGPVDGFMIHTPDDRKLKDTHPQTIVRELNRMADRIRRLEEAGDKLNWAWLNPFDPAGETILENWTKAKEDK